MVPKELQSNQDEATRNARGKEAIRDVQLTEQGKDNVLSTHKGRGETPGGLATGTRALGISPTLIKQGYVDLRGAEAKDARDVAALAQVFRDPRFETFRYIYVKDGKYSLRYVNKIKALKWAQSVGRLFSPNEATHQGHEKPCRGPDPPGSNYPWMLPRKALKP